MTTLAKLAERTSPMTGPCGCENCDCGFTIEKLQAFKDWVHTYLDSKSVPYHPPGTHGAEGCRIGDRMDWLMTEMEALRRQNAELEKGFRDLLTECESLQSLFVRGPQKIWVEKAHDKISEVIFAARTALANTKETQ